jgi:hypothetical protein
MEAGSLNRTRIVETLNQNPLNQLCRSLLRQEQMEATLGQLEGQNAVEAGASLLDNLYSNLSEMLPGLRL